MQDIATYRADFFSGANIGIWFRDTRFVEAYGIEFTQTQTKMPVYGWASQLWDGLAQGIVQVAGVLYVNFREAYLINAMIDNTYGIEATDFSSTVELGQDLEGRLEDPETIAILNQGQINKYKQTYWQQTRNVGQARRPDDHNGTFHIRITYGDYGNQDTIMAEAGYAIPATLKQIFNVSITGSGQSIEINGKPILEAYNFLARQII